LYSNTTGAGNTALGGYRTLFTNTTGANNTAVGMQALQSNLSASNNTAVGYQAGYLNSTAGSQTFVGYQAGYNTTAQGNTFIGKEAGLNNTTGQANTYLGNNSGVSMTTGSKNTIVGIYSGNQGGLDIRTASNYIVLSDGDGNPRGFFDGSGNFRVGTTGGGTRRVQIESASANYTLGIYNTASTPYGFYAEYSTSPNDIGSQFLVGADSTTTRVELRSNGGIANYAANNVILSDRREKTNFAPATSYLEKICAIPVQTFNYIDQNLEEDGGLTLGVVAQDVQAVAPELVTEGNWGTKENPKMRFEIYQTDLQYALMKCIQEQQTIIESLKARLDAANL
jgi:hypothetical protein